MSGRLDEPQARGTFFKLLGTLAAGYVAERLEDAVSGVVPPLLRPPGALDELAFLATCTRCGRCRGACPQGALVEAPPGAGLAMGTPCLVPRGMPCFLCADLPCVAACPAGALVWPRREGLEGPRAAKMGTARVDASRCLTWAGEDREAQACRICLERCPFPGEAISLEAAEAGGIAHPQVREARCAGCGLCVHACPAPLAAIAVEPRM